MGVAEAGIPADACTRPAIGSVVAPSPDLRSAGGSLRVEFALRTSVDRFGLRLYCYVYQGGIESPTLRVKPGDRLTIQLTNHLPPDASELSTATTRQPVHPHAMEIRGPCGGGRLDASATNLHFHGMEVPPGCHQDDVLSTLVQASGPAYEYDIRIPATQPPGLYWYHPHPHGFSEAQVLGGASGALIIEGIERADNRVAGLPERVLVLRDQVIPGLSDSQEDAGPGKDVSLNFVPIMYPLYRPAEMRLRPGQREFWRVLNASADTYFDLQVRTGATIQDVNQPQRLELVAMDGVATGWAPSGPKGEMQQVLLPPGARAEFLVTTPAAGAFGQLVSLRYDTGPDGEATPYRVLANLRISPDAPALPAMPASPGLAGPPSMARSIQAEPARVRRLYFSEVRLRPDDPTSPISYRITEEGSVPRPFDMNVTQPDITVEQGTVEDWVIENRAREAHAFHIHQLHFQVLERNGRKSDEPQFRDTIDIPYWDGKSNDYPSVKLRMDFRNPDFIGTFLYHCHILEHEDGGMMGTIRVTPSPAGR